MLKMGLLILYYFVLNDELKKVKDGTTSIPVGSHNHDDRYSKLDHSHNDYIGDIYVGTDGKLHKKTVGGADTVLPFSNLPDRCYPNVIFPLVKIPSSGILAGFRSEDKIIAIKSSGSPDSTRNANAAFSATGNWLPKGAYSGVGGTSPRNEWLAIAFENPINVQAWRIHNTNTATSGQVITMQYLDPEDIPSGANWYDATNPWKSKGSITFNGTPSVLGTTSDYIIDSNDRTKHKYYRLFESKSVQIGHFELMNWDV